MGASGPGKICVVCGVDCAGKPRTRDPAGRYYCNGCYERAIEAKAKGGSTATAAAVTDAEPLLTGTDPALLEAITATMSAVAVNVCPECGHVLVDGKRICTSCGFDRRTGQRVESETDKRDAEKKKEPEIPPAVLAAAQKSTWHLKLGACAMTLGIGSIIIYAFSIIGAVQDRIATASFQCGFACLLMLGVPLGFAIYLTVAGLRTIRRERRGALQLKNWAWLKLYVYTPVFLGAWFIFFFMPDLIENDWMLRRRTGSIGSLMDSHFIAFAVMSLWIFWWPGFIAWWLARHRQHVRTWSV